MEPKPTSKHNEYFQKIRLCICETIGRCYKKRNISETRESLEIKNMKAKVKSFSQKVEQKMRK